MCTALSCVHAASTASYPSAALFDSTPVEWEIGVTIDEVSGLVNPLVDVFDYSDDDTETLIEGIAEVGPMTAPSLDAQRNPIESMSPASGRARVTSDLENIGDVSGVFYGDIGERIRIRSSSSLSMDLEYIGMSDGQAATAIICLMPMQLAVVEGGTGTDPASAMYFYSVEVDGDEIFTSSMSLSGTSTSAVLSSEAGALRTDGVFFEDLAYNTFGYNFPALTVSVPMGMFDAGEIKEAEIRFTTTLEAPDNDWGGYAGPNGGAVDPITFIPTIVPEPQAAGFLLAGLLLALRRNHGRKVEGARF